MDSVVLVSERHSFLPPPFCLRNTQITWLKDGQPLPVTLRFCENYYYGVATLEIVGVEKDDEGVYTCAAENELGKAKTECLLSVEGKIRVTILAARVHRVTG